MKIKVIKLQFLHKKLEWNELKLKFWNGRFKTERQWQDNVSDKVTNNNLSDKCECDGVAAEPALKKYLKNYVFIFTRKTNETATREDSPLTDLQLH